MDIDNSLTDIPPVSKTTGIQRVSLLIIFGSIAVVLFYHADDLTGAVGLRAYYYILGIILSVFYIQLAWGLLVHFNRLAVALALALAVLWFLCTGLTIIVVGWAAFVLISFIPTGGRCSRHICFSVCDMGLGKYGQHNTP